MTFEPGRTVVHRSWRGGRISFMQVTRVVADDDRGLFLWLPIGTRYWRIVGADGRTHHDAAINELGADAELAELTWSGYDCLIWKSPGDAVAVWWFFRPDGEFTGWYANLEEPMARWDDGGVAGVDFADQALDITVEPNRTWQWKDLPEFEAKTGHPLYWDDAEAAQIRAEGERVAKLIETAAFPFDGSWCDFRPEPSWPIPVRADGWDRPRA